MSREASKLWKKVCSEMNVEINLMLGNWKNILGGIVFQYIHGLAARGVHYLHRPGPVLQDLGFFLIPELGQRNAYISESMFGVIFFSFILWTFTHLFIRTRHSTVLLWRLVLVYLVHSILPSYLAQTITAVSYARGLYGRGGLIFSSHMIFTLVFVNTYYKYDTKR